MKKIQRDIVAALIFSKDGKLFQGMKDSAGGGVYLDCWHIPGGGIEPGEDRMQAVIREVKEETGIDIAKYPIELVDATGRGESEKVLKETGEKVIVAMTFHTYKVIIEDKNADEIAVALHDDLVEYHWVDLADVRNYKLTPPSVELFKKLKYIE